MTLGPLHILVTDDHATTRLGIKQILLEAFRTVACGDAGSAEDTLRELGRQAWDLLILDISLPGRDGLDLLQEVKRTYPDLPVLMFSVHPEEQFASRALRLQASGYLTKERAPEELEQAVRRVLSGGTYVSPALAARMTGGSAGASSIPAHDALSDREFQVLRALVKGLPGKVIAADLSLSEKTVSTYRTRMLKKLGLQTTAELVEYAVRHDLVR